MDAVLSSGSVVRNYDLVSGAPDVDINSLFFVEVPGHKILAYI